jgi:hypothetical protein
VPHLVEGLSDVEEDRRAQCAFLKACHDRINNPMRLLDRGVAGSKTKLVTRNEVGKVHIGPESLQEEFLKDLRRKAKEADRAIGRDVLGRLTRFWHNYNLCKFPQEQMVGEAEHAVVESDKEDDSRGW